MRNKRELLKAYSKISFYIQKEDYIISHTIQKCNNFTILEKNNQHYLLL